MKHPHKVGKTNKYQQPVLHIRKHPHVVGKTNQFAPSLQMIWKHPHAVGKTQLHSVGQRAL